jgi:hypothetical protein
MPEAVDVEHMGLTESGAAARESLSPSSGSWRLWLSYQRYALGIAAVALVLPTALALAGAAWGWVVGSLPVTVIGVLRARTIARQWRVKIGETRRADRRIADGSFEPEQVRRWCVDPCWRAVAREVLERSGRTATEARDLVRGYSAMT